MHSSQNIYNVSLIRKFNFVVGAICSKQAPCVLEVLHLCIALERRSNSLVVPRAQQDATIGCGQLVILPLLQVVVVVQPLIHQLAEVYLDMAAESTVNRLDVVGLVGRQLVVVNAQTLQHVNVARLLLRVQVVLEE